MLKFIEFVRKKPSNLTIRLVRLGFGWIIIATILLGYTDFSLGISDIIFPDWTKYLLLIIPAISIIRGAFDPGWFRKKVWKYIQITIAFILIFGSWIFIIENHPTKNLQTEIQGTSTGGTVSIADITNSLETKNSDIFIDVGLILGLLWWFSLLVAITGKNITTTREKHGEKIMKIRV